MKLKCKRCGHTETVNKHFFLKIIGGTVTATGYWAWVTYLMAGTGLAMPICVAIMAGGVAIAAFSNEIAIWASKRYKCPKCKAKDWQAVE